MKLETSKKERNRAKKRLVIQVNDKPWSQFIESIEHRVHRRKLVAYKTLRGMNKNENDSENLNIIP